MAKKLSSNDILYMIYGFCNTIILAIINSIFIRSTCLKTKNPKQDRIVIKIALLMEGPPPTRQL